MKIFVFGCNSRLFYDGGSAAVVAEDFAQAKKLLAEQEISEYKYYLEKVISIEEAIKTPQVLSAFFHIE